jgi:DNA polymerase-1
MTSQPVYIVDALNYIFRAYHAIPPGALTSPSGEPTNAVLGYTRTLLRIIKERKPERLVSVFEGDTSFRSELYPEYKANRAAMPPDLAPQISHCRRITEAIGIPVYEASGFEADDVIGTVATKIWSLGYPAVIVTGDKDMSQLVCGGIRIYDMARESWLDEAAVREKFGVTPRQIPDLLALHGDAVDNIPGVEGVGPKTARQILAVCASVEDLAGPRESLGGIAIRSRDQILERIRNSMDAVRLSRKLATICCEAPVTVTPESVRYRRANQGTLAPLCKELGFRRLMDEIPLAQPTLFQ